MTETVRWERVKTALHAALEQDPSKRIGFLERLCRNDQDLFEEVRSLLSAYDPDYLEEPAARLTGPEPPPPPKTIGAYRVVEKIGAGGMGEVYKVVDGEDRVFALKRLPRELVSKEGLSRLRREAMAASALEHPHVVRFVDLVEHEGRPHIVMEYLDGRTLKQILAGERALEFPDSVAVAIQVAEALEAAHEKGIVHRDLKPGNILVTRNASVKLLDFGIAKLLENAPGGGSSPLERITKTGQILGTAEYMAPEQARGEKVDARCDIFAFGCVLYRMLSGKSAFAGESTIEKFGSIQNDEPEPLRTLVPGLPESMAELTHRCLAKDAAKRPESMADVLTVLREMAFH